MNFEIIHKIKNILFLCLFSFFIYYSFNNNDPSVGPEIDDIPDFEYSGGSLDDLKEVHPSLGFCKLTITGRLTLDLYEDLSI
jgi:hypothetical protein